MVASGRSSVETDMGDLARDHERFPLEQQPIHDNCFHPSGAFLEVPQEVVERSILARFEKILRLYPKRLAIKAGNGSLTYRTLNQCRQSCSPRNPGGAGRNETKRLLEHVNRQVLTAGDRSSVYVDLNQHADRIAPAILERRGRGSEPIACSLNVDCNTGQSSTLLQLD
jgi:hypothetical protein